MPRLVILEDEGFKPLTEEAYLAESDLQRLLEEHPELIALDDVDPTASPLLPIGREVSLAGQSLDLLFIDRAGRLTAVETKLRRNAEIRREVVGQILEYGAHLATWTVEDVERQAARYFADPRTPLRFRDQSLYHALARVGGSEPTDGAERADIQSKISESLKRYDLRLIVGVDRVVDPLRNLVVFTNSASRFSMYLLEVQQYRAPDGVRIASINVYGGPVGKRDSGPRPNWDENRFLETLRSQASPEAARAVEALYAFIQERADSLVWGTGASEGSVGFGVRRGGDRVTIFFVTTKGRVWIAMGPLNRRTPREARASLLEILRSLGIDAPDELLEGDRWPMFDAVRLGDNARLESYKSAVLNIAASIE